MKSLSHSYSRWVKNVFERSAATYNQVGPDWFGYFGRSLVDQAGVREGELVLDLACGRGASLLPARDRTGNKGLAVGADLAAHMLKNVKSVHHDDEEINLAQMDALRLGFAPAAFDVIQCGFALFFMPDLSGVLRQVARVLKPGGRFVASTFGERDIRWAPLGEIAKGVEAQLAQVPEQDIPDLDTAEAVIDTLESAGFEEIEVVSITREFYFADEQEWWNTMWSHGGRGFLERMSPEILADFQAQVFRFLKTIKGDQGIPNRFDVLITRCRKPGKYPREF